MSRMSTGREKGKGKERDVDSHPPLPSTSTTSRTLPTTSSISSTKPSQRPSQQKKKALIFAPGVGFHHNKKPQSVGPPIPNRGDVTCSAPAPSGDTVAGSQAAAKTGRKESKKLLAPISTFIPSRSSPSATTVDPGPSKPSLRPPSPSPSHPDSDSPSSPTLLFRSTATPSPKRRRIRRPTPLNSPLKPLRPPPPPTPTPPLRLPPSSPDLFFYESPPSSSAHSAGIQSTLSPSPQPPTPTPRKRPRPTSNPTPEPDWSQCDPRLLTSILFRSEYLIYGNPDYRQAYRDPFKPKPSKRVGSKKSSTSCDAIGSTVAVAERSKPTWFSEDIKLPSNLAGRLLTDEEFLISVWAKDIVGVSEEGGEKKPCANGMRVEWIDGTKVYLLGKEFPCLKVSLMGYIVGVDVKEDESTRESRVTYYLDDSTAVVQCTCTLLAPTRSFIPTQFLPRIYPEEGGISKAVMVKRKPDPIEVEPPPIVFEVGTLVQVVGRVTEGSFAWQERFVTVDKIEALRDATLEADHHVLVARMHRNVYDVPLDLVALLEKGEAAEKERSWETASIATSEAGSPRKQEKRFKLADPSILDPARLTPSTLITYINNYLRNHRLGRPPGPSSRPSSQASSCGIPWGNTSFSSEDDVPRPFTIDDLERNKRLKRFAELMAQRNEVLRRQKKKAKVQPFDPKVWIAKPEAELKRRDATSSAGSSERSGQGTPLDETGLAKATRRIFVDAIRTMRKDGKIVVSEPMSFSSPVKLPDVRISPVSTRTESKKAHATDQDSAWKSVGLGKSSRPALPTWSPWGEMMDANDLESLETPKAKKSSNRRREAEEVQIGPWRLSDATDFEELLEEDKTPRAAYRSSFKVPAPTNQAHLHPGDISTSTSAGNTTWSTSMMESTTESFELVTTTSLEPHILRILEEAKSDQSWKGLMAESIRKILAMDPRWEAVAVYSPLVSNTLDELEMRGMVRRAGHCFSASD